MVRATSLLLAPPDISCGLLKDLGARPHYLGAFDLTAALRVNHFWGHTAPLVGVRAVTRGTWLRYVNRAMTALLATLSLALLVKSH